MSDFFRILEGYQNVRKLHFEVPKSEEKMIISKTENSLLF